MSLRCAVGGPPLVQALSDYHRPLGGSQLGIAADRSWRLAARPAGTHRPWSGSVGDWKQVSWRDLAMPRTARQSYKPAGGEE